MDTPSDTCPAERLAEALVTASDEAQGLENISRLLEDYPSDSQLHFLRGSILAGLGKYAEGIENIRRAIEISPDYALARFQLGLLHVTSGDVDSGEAVWAPLQALAPSDPLLLFAQGLGQFVRDDFNTAIDLLRRGIAQNQDNEPLNKDMQMMIDAAQEALGRSNASAEPVSSAQALLQQYDLKRTRH